jgi:hypothetical protein
MITLEELVSQIDAIPPSDGSRWHIKTLIERRLHASRGAAGDFTLFVEGEQPSFGALPPVVGLEHSDKVFAVPEGRELSALRIGCADAVYGNRVIAHIAYELMARLGSDPGVDNGTLLEQVGWVLPLLGTQESVLSPERQRGLVGECLLLRQLMILAPGLGLGASAVLDRWWGHTGAMRDFAATDLAIEVKCTALNSRQHHISSLEQLDPDSPTQQVFLFSVGIKSDPTAQRKLPHFIGDVEAQIVDATGRPDEAGVERFKSQLASYGYQDRHEAIYSRQSGFVKPHLAPALFRETDLDRLRLSSFVGASLPDMVASVSYVLDIKADPLPDMEAIDALKRLLTQPPVTSQ